MMIITQNPYVRGRVSRSALVSSANPILSRRKPPSAVARVYAPAQDPFAKVRGQPDACLGGAQKDAGRARSEAKVCVHLHQPAAMYPSRRLFDLEGPVQS